MKARALICDERQRFSLANVEIPEPGDDDILIRTVYSGVSIGTEFALIRGKLSWGPYPLCTGYQGSGVVEKVGARRTDRFKVGQNVYFRGNSNMQMQSGQTVSSVSGTHCSHAVFDPVMTNGAEILPDGVPMELAALFVMPGVGAAGVDRAAPKMGQTVLVYGVGAIGLGVVAACATRGCVVIAVDVNTAALEIACKMGADHAINADQPDLRDAVQKIVPNGADFVFECTGLPKCIHVAMELARNDGTFVWQGNYGAGSVAFDFHAAHWRQLRMVFPCGDGGPACRRAVLKGMASGTLPWQHTVTHRVHFREAPSLYDRINNGDRSIVGAVIDWDHRA